MIKIGDNITGRCVTSGLMYTGRVIEVIHPKGYGDSSPRYKLTNTGMYYSNGRPIEPIVFA